MNSDFGLVRCQAPNWVTRQLVQVIEASPPDSTVFYPFYEYLPRALITTQRQYFLRRSE